MSEEETRGGSLWPSHSLRLIDLGLSIRTENLVLRALADAGHVPWPARVVEKAAITLDEVCLLTEAELRLVKGCGPKTLTEVREAMERIGRTLRSEVEAQATETRLPNLPQCSPSRNRQPADDRH